MKNPETQAKPDETGDLSSPKWSKVIPENIPAELKKYDQWVVWRSDPAKGKITKVPYNAKTGYRASSVDPKTWSTFQAALKAYQSGKYDGMGFVLSPTDTFTGWDLDHCINAGSVEPWALKYIQRLNSYTEISPSGSGLRVIVKESPLPPQGRKKGPIEVYADGRFLTFTGHVLNGVALPIESRPLETLELHQKTFGKPDPPPQENKTESPSMDDQRLLEKMFASKSGDKIRRLFEGDYSDHPSWSDADLAFNCHLAFWFNKDASANDRIFRQSGLYRPKWDEKHRSDGQTYGQMTINKALAFTTETYKGGSSPDQDFASPEQAAEIRQAFEQKIETLNPETDFEILTEILVKEIQGSSLSESAKHSLLKKITKKTDTTLKSLKDTAKKSEEKNENIFYDVAIQTIEKYGDGNILFANNTFYQWVITGVWESFDDREIKQIIHDIFLKRKEKISKTTDENILDIVKTETFKPGHRFNLDRNSINCLNGELYWTGTSWELKTHCRESYRTTQIPVEYDPQAPAPQFEKFLDDIFQGDPDRDQKSILICEIIGYCLLSSTEYEKFIILVGNGANGKSVFLSVLQALLGFENTAAVQPDQFDNKFQRAHLDGKLANLISELPEGGVLPDAQMKSITSGELMTAEHKFKMPFDFVPFCTLIFATNHLPHSRDFSEALFRRAIVIPFNRVFQEHEQDKQLANKLKTELPGILNLALEAMAGVFERGYFTQTASCEDAKKQWRYEADQAAQFINDQCERIPGNKETSQDLYNAYRQWADYAGINKVLNKNNFIKRMVLLGAERYTDGVSRGLLGLKLKND